MGAAASPWLSLRWSQHWGCPSINLCSPQLPLPFSSVAIPTTRLTPSLNLYLWPPGLGPHLSAFSSSLQPEAGSGFTLSRPLTPRFPFTCPQGPSRKQKRVRWKGRWQPGSQAHPEGPRLQPLLLCRKQALGYQIFGFCQRLGIRIFICNWLAASSTKKRKHCVGQHSPRPRFLTAASLWAAPASGIFSSRRPLDCSLSA